MKKLFTLILVFSFLFSQAQVRIGVKAGADFYNFTGKGVKDNSLDDHQQLKTGLVAGAFVEIPVSSVLSVQPSLLYSQEGNLQKDGNDKAIYKFDYLNLPVVLKYNHSSGFFGETGPQLGYKLNSKLKTIIGGTETETKLTNGLNDFLFSWTVGAGWKFKNGLGINARSQWGITSISDNEKLTNSGFYASLTYTCKSKK